ncbi:hypothetical protein SAMN06309944_1136 [Micrococcales bacterium KH10]|nr:hypothetical protein SAMN06309944_1136 [Micrococcales bacterium KH10]
MNTKTLHRSLTRLPTVRFDMRTSNIAHMVFMQMPNIRLNVEFDGCLRMSSEAWLLAAETAILAPGEPFNVERFKITKG